MVEENVRVKYTVDGAQALVQGNALTKMFGALSSIGITPAVFGIGALVAGLKKATEMMGESQLRVTELNQALMNNGLYTAKVSNELQDYAKQMQKKTIYDDESVIRAEALFVSYGLQVNQIKELTKRTADFAAIKRIDLGEAAMLVAKTFGTETNALSRQGVIVNGAAGSTERLGSLMQGLAKFTGQAESQANTFNGSLKQLKNATDDFWEALGYAVTGGGKSGLIKGLTKIVNWAEDLAYYFGIGVRVIMNGVANINDRIAIVANNIAAAFRRMLHMSTKDLDDDTKKKNDLIKNREKDLNDYITKQAVDKNIRNNGIQKNEVESLQDKEDKKQKIIEKAANKILEDHKLYVSTLSDLDEQRKQKELADLEKTIQKTKKAGGKIAELVIEKNNLINDIEKDAADKRNKIEQDVEQRKTEQLERYAAYFRQEQASQVNIATAAAQAMLGVYRDNEVKKAEMWMAGQTLKAQALLFMGPAGWAEAAGIMLGVGVAAAGTAALRSIKLAQGGTMVVDSPTRIGNNVIAGEAGPEKITVQPLGRKGRANRESSQGSVNLSVHVGNDRVYKKTLKYGQGMRAERILDDGISIN